MSTPEQRIRMAKPDRRFRGSRDKKGHLQVYKLPAWDGGGRYEVAGINEARLSPPLAAQAVGD